MTKSDRDKLPISPAQPNRSDADRFGAEKLDRFDLLLFDDASKALADVAAGKVEDARGALAVLRRRLYNR